MIDLEFRLQVTDQLRLDLHSLGFRASDIDGEYLLTTDRDPRMADLRAWADRYHRMLLPGRVLGSSAELDAVPAFELAASWHHGYPQPEDDFGYEQITYAPGSVCPQCGAGRRQVAPFRMVRVPAWGSRQILQLNWVFDEFFVTPAFARDVLEPLGVPTMEVHNRRAATLGSVVQVVAQAEVDVDVTGVPVAVCTGCGRARHSPETRLFPAPDIPDGLHYVHSRQWFGSGSSSSRLVLVSQELRRRIAAIRRPGVELYPTLPSTSTSTATSTGQGVRPTTNPAAPPSPTRQAAPPTRRSPVSTPPGASAPMDIDRATLLERLQATHAAIAARYAAAGEDPAAAGLVLDLEPGATDAELLAMEAHIGRAIPPSLRALFATARACTFEWVLTDGAEPPDPFGDLYIAEWRWSLAELPTLLEEYEGWRESVFPNPDDPVDEIWYDKFPVLDAGDSDYLTLDPAGRVVYVSHENGDGHGLVLADALGGFLDAWTRLGAPGPRDLVLGSLLTGPEGALDPDGPDGVAWRQWLGLT